MTEGALATGFKMLFKMLFMKESKDVASVVTQVVVDKNDPALSTPAKPIGPFYSEEEAKAEAEK